MNLKKSKPLLTQPLVLSKLKALTKLNASKQDRRRLAAENGCSSVLVVGGIGGTRAMQLHALLIDDDVGLCELVTEFMAKAGVRLQTVGDGETGVHSVRQNAFDIILLDVMLPNLDGFMTLQRIRRLTDTPVIMLTARGDESDRIRGFDLGADDYVAKPFSTQELLRRIRAIVRRVAPSDSMVLVGDLLFHQADNTIERSDGQRILLTESESTILGLLVQRVGLPVLREDIYRTVFQREFSPFDSSLYTHVCNLRRKLGRRTDGGPRIQTVRGVGYRYLG